MAHMIRLILTILIFTVFILPSQCAIKGGLEYKIPIDYSALDQQELETQAESYYNIAIKSKKLDNNMTSALNLYGALSAKCPENTIYAVKLGKLYDVLGKDRYAKGNFSRAIGIDPSRPEGYFYLAEFYFERQQYRKALKYYTIASQKGFSAQSASKINIINKKLGK